MNDRYTETFDTWNKVASLYQERFMDLDLYNETYEYVCANIAKPNAKLLEIGCGPGNITRYLLSRRPDFNIFGIDIAPNMIELARKNNPAAEFAVMDSREISRLTEKFDGLIAGFCLPYLSQAESIELISTAAALLHENGLIYLSFVEGDPGESEFKTGSSGRVFFHYHRLTDIKKELSRNKFEDIIVSHIAYKNQAAATEIHTVLTAKRGTH